MKNRILYIVVMLMVSLSASAQSVTESLYVYRNDGKINAFYPNEIDSMTYSNRDLNGVEHNDMVVQEIWTADSVYRIPLSVIDSISVNTPEVIYAPKVKKLDPDYLPYLKKVDELTLSFSNDLPYALRINNGDILLYEKFDDRFEFGFAGKVESVSSEGDLLVAACEPASLSEIYDQFIAVDNFMLEGDEQGASGTRASGSATIDVPVALNLKMGSYGSINGSGKLSLNIKVTANISNGHSFIELIPHYSLDLGASISMSCETGGKPNFTSRLFSVPLVFTHIPFLKGEIAFDEFVKASFKGKVEVGVNTKMGGGVAVTYEDGKLKSSRIPFTINTNLDGSAGAEGNLWSGIVVAPSIYAVGKVVEFSFLNGFGPNFEFNIKADLFSGSTYESIKDGTLETSLKLASEFEATHILQNPENKFKRACGPEVKFAEHTFYLLPDFTNPEVKSDTKSITVSTKAVRDILIPCKVGLCILDEGEKVIEKYYDIDSKTALTPEFEINYTFENNLKQGKKYIVRPLVKLFGMEFQANPEQECYLDCNVSTGMAYATLSSFEASGSVEAEMPYNVESGFLYTTEKTNPRIDNAKRCVGTFTDKKVFKGATVGLKPGTTYYYCAYVSYNNQYYYGDTQCVTTKKNIDKFNEDNPGGGYRPGNKAYVSTGQSGDIEMEDAVITLTYNCVSPSTECGYYLQADTKKGGTLAAKYYSLGTVTGTQTVELTGLIPGTKYTYWGVASNSAGKAVSNQKTFKTEPSPDPVAKILDVTDITMQGATIECYFENLEEAKECGIEYSEGEFTYREKVRPDANGNAKVELNKLVAETNYTVTPYVEVEDADAPFTDEPTEFTTLGPDITGWWVFNDAQGGGIGRTFDLEIRNNGRTNNFYGVNSLSWTRDKRNITLLWESSVGGYTSTARWEYRGVFDENFTKVTGEAFYVVNSPNHDLNDEMFSSGEYVILRRKN